MTVLTMGLTDCSALERDAPILSTPVYENMRTQNCVTPTSAKRPSAAGATLGMPPVRNTPVQRSTFCTSTETEVTVIGVEYFRPDRKSTRLNSSHGYTSYA